MHPWWNTCLLLCGTLSPGFGEWKDLFLLLQLFATNPNLHQDPRFQQQTSSLVYITCIFKHVFLSLACDWPWTRRGGDDWSANWVGLHPTKVSELVSIHPIKNLRFPLHSIHDAFQVGRVPYFFDFFDFLPTSLPTSRILGNRSAL